MNLIVGDKLRNVSVATSNGEQMVRILDGIRKELLLCSQFAFKVVQIVRDFFCLFRTTARAEDLFKRARRTSQLLRQRLGHHNNNLNTNKLN